MYADYKIDDQFLDKKSQGSCKLSKSRKIKKQNDKPVPFEKDKQKTPKITNFFKKLTHDDFQRPRTSSRKKQQKRSPEQEQRIQELQNEQKQLLHQEELLKKEIQTLKSQEQMKFQEWNGYLKKLRHCEIVDLKQRYKIIRLQKGLPDGRRMQIESNQFIHQEGSQNLHHSKLTFEIKQVLEKIKQKQQILKNVSISKIQRNNLEKDVAHSQGELKFAYFQNQQYQQKVFLSQKQKTCKFSQLNWPLIAKRYQTLQLIGCGGYSEVYKALNLSNNEFVAIKLCSVTEMAQMSPELYLKHLFRECQTHKNLNHPNIVKLHEVVQLDKSTFCLILELCEGPELSRYIKRKGRLYEQQAKSIMFQVFETLYYLSNFSAKKIVHYDLKPLNIMFHQGLVKILDFGLTKQIDEEESRAALTSAGLGTHAYLPPQIHQYDTEDDRVLTSKVDIWSSGIIFYELLNGKRPTRMEDIEIKQSSQISVNKQTIEIIKSCLKLDPAERITPQDVYFHPYFNQFERRYQRK